MKAVIMAGGEGSRLRPLTIRRPKPMVPVVDRPAIVHIIELLKRHGITEVVITLQYLSSVIQEYLGDGSTFGMKIHYTIEDTPLGTAGSVRLGREWLDETFIVISGDALTDFDLTAAVDYHAQHRAIATIVLKRMPNPLEYGVVIINDDGRVQQFQEKPSWGEVFSDTVNTGIYVFDPRIFKHYDDDIPFDFSSQLFPILLEKKLAMFGYVADGYWCDIGSIPDYMTACSDYLQGRVDLPREGKELRPGSGIWVENEVEIDKDAQINGPVFLGAGVRIKDGVVINGPTVIRESSIIETRAAIDRAIIWRNCYIGERAEVRGAILQTQVNVKPHAMIFEGAVIGDGTIVGDTAVIRPNVKIWPSKEIESGATISSSIIWGAQGRRNLFGRFGVTGLVNVDLTPEFAAKLGAAYGGILPKGTTVTVNRDSHYTPRMIKRAMIAGLPSAGINVLDLRNVPIPVARYYTRVIGAAGGIHVRLSPFDARVVDIKFFDKRGLDLDKAAERKIEGFFFREDFRRAYLDDIGRIDYANDVEQRYNADYLKALDVEAIKNSGDKFNRIAVDYANSSPSLVLPNLLGKLNSDVVALNAVVHEASLYQTDEQFDEATERLGAITRTVEAGFGVRLDPGGERVVFVDGRGKRVPEITALAVVVDLALAQHYARNGAGGIAVVPVYAPSIFEKIAARYEAEIVRARYNSYALMTAALRTGVVVAGDARGGVGGFIFPQFHPASDGLFTVAKVLELTATQGVTFTEAIDRLPHYAIWNSRVQCAWENKGRVMRILNEQYRDSTTRQVDGVKIDLGNGEWALILPDADRPIIHIIAEADTEAAARKLVDKYAGLVQGLQ